MFRHECGMILVKWNSTVKNLQRFFSVATSKINFVQPIFELIHYSKFFFVVGQAQGQVPSYNRSYSRISENNVNDQLLTPLWAFGVNV